MRIFKVNDNKTEACILTPVKNTKVFGINVKVNEMIVVRPKAGWTVFDNSGECLNWSGFGPDEYKRSYDSLRYLYKNEKIPKRTNTFLSTLDFK